MIHNKFRYLLTLVALFAISTGAWAEGTVYNSSVDIHNLQAGDILVEGAAVTGIESPYGFKLMPYFLQSQDDEHYSLQSSSQVIANSYAQVTIIKGGVLEYIRTDSGSRYTFTPCDADINPFNAWIVTQIEGDNNKRVQITAYQNAEPPIVVNPGSSANTWTFSMPGSDVVLTPIYAKAAAFATTGTEPEVKTLLPEAAEGVIAGTDASLIAEGTGIVAFAGESTEVTQGTLMYAIGTSATEAPALTAFSATVPTAKNIADDGATLYVWYYIQGADAPDGVAATLDNTFDNTEPACLTVQVLTNKFDIQFNAANANTIEAGKATVTVGGTAATVTEGKLQGVKMGSEVKVKANTGYKFRKVEVKKAGPAADIVWDGTNVSDLHVEGNYLSYTKEGIKLSGNAEQVQAEWNNSAYLGTPGMEFITMESGGFTFTAPTGKAFTKIEMKAVGDGGWATENLGTGWAYNTGTVTWTGSAASTVKLLKDADMFSGDFISSIAFYLSE